SERYTDSSWPSQAPGRRPFRKPAAVRGRGAGDPIHRNPKAQHLSAIGRCSAKDTKLPVADSDQREWSGCTLGTAGRSGNVLKRVAASYGGRNRSSHEEGHRGAWLTSARGSG